MASKGLIFNQDSDNFLFTRQGRLELLTEQYLKDFIYQYKDTGITDFMMCTNVHISAFPSQIKTFYGDKYLRTEELGRVVDYTNTCCKVAHYIWYEQKLDLFQIWIDACREVGMAPWLSFRMNDAHCHFEEPHYLLSDYFYEHIDEYARGRQEVPYGGQRGYYDRCRDFEIYEVRQEMLDYIEEALERYDVEGIELDFMRELWCFRPGHEQNDTDLMTAFVQEVKQVVKSAEARYSHPIKIAARCHSNPVYSLEFGFDILEWAKRGLIDLIVPSPRWATTNNDMPIVLWKKMMEPYGVEVAGCIELLTRSHPRGRLAYNSVESALGSVVNILSQGADYAYIFNYFDHPEEMLVGEHRKLTTENNVQKAEGYYKLLTIAADFDKARNTTRRHLVTYEDIVPLNRKFAANLPIEVKANGPHYIRIVTGQITPESKVLLRLGICPTSEETFDPSRDIAVFINSEKVGFMEKQQCSAPLLTDSWIYVFEVPLCVTGSLVQMAGIYGNADFTIDYADITIEVV